MKISKLSLLAVFCCSLTLGFGLLGCGDDDDDPVNIVDDPCEHPSAICGESPSGAITGFRITTTTGMTGTDLSKIQFCFQRKGSSNWECHELDNPGVDDFESLQTDNFDIDISTAPVVVGNFSRFRIILTNNLLGSWDIAALTVTAKHEGGGETVLYQEPSIEECHNPLREDHAFVPLDCTY